MAGGQGTKLWPISTEDNPKQFNYLLGSKSLFQLNVESLLLKYKPEDIFVSTTEPYIKFVKEQTPMIPENNYIVEPPLKKMTGPASGYAMLKVAQQYPDEVVMFYVQPVVIREPAEAYIKMVDGIEKLVKKSNKLVTGGKYPLYPEVGSDYLEIGAKVAGSTDIEAYEGIGFVERPKTLADATEMLQKIKVILHCNHYTWTPAKLLEAYKIYKPDWYEILMKIKEALGKPNEYEAIKELYAKFEPGNVELVTKNLYDAGETQIVILPFEWAHITTWNDIYEYYKKRDIANIQGKVLQLEGQDNLIISTDAKVVATIGLTDFVVVNTDNAILICPRNQSGKLTTLLKEIEATGFKDVL